MTREQVIAFVLFSVAAAGTPGPSNTLLTATGASAAATFLDRSAGDALGQSAAMGLTFALVSLPSCLPWLGFGAVLQGVLRSERAARVFNVAMGVLLAASVLLIVR